MLQNRSEIRIPMSLVNDSCDQIAQMQQKLGHSIKTLSIDYMVEQFRNNHFYIPTFQRPLVWNNRQQARFIEAVILDFPIPFMFIASTDEDEQFEILDGCQRIQTLEAFLSNHLKLSNLEIVSSLNGIRFSELTPLQQNKLKSLKMTVFILRKTAPLDIRHEMFRQLNAHSMPLQI
jgi:uncharacterized protein with ParB-like and HNH nuclease domain